MDFEKMLEGYKNKTCIISIERFSDGTCGNIRIAAGNKAHCDEFYSLMKRDFEPGIPYDEFYPKDMNYEDYCYRCAFLGQSIHTYVKVQQLGVWVDLYLLPLKSDKEDTGYCLLSYEVTPKADTDIMSHLSADTSSKVIKTCIKLRGSDNTAETFYDVIEDIRQICDSDHCCILLVDERERRCTTLCESLRPDCDLLPMDSYLDDNFYNIASTWDDTIGGSSCVVVKDEQDMKWLSSVNPLWYRSLTDAGVKSIVLFPLAYNGNTLGYMWAINFNVDNTVKIRETLQLTTFFIASEISNYQLLQRFEMLSSADALTGVKNRNTMNNMVDSVIWGKHKLRMPFAVIFADLNGLKRVNDAYGHGAGDNMLKTAASMLKEVFFDSEVYRAGGDEFMIIAAGITEDELEKRLDQLKKQAERTSDVRFSIGTCFCDSGNDILMAMRYADEKMYADKERYYRQHPEMKYR
ncbi:MAG: sensor domain-containing diguanylate cyclase [Ruminococcus sp.]|uniref:sensor domain-containing diguanylate cyclase n=1 Tax=Ruminococcus sp. TaxID=41978 RepID=UPI001B2F0095|nr:sensor domain-containing diguanylate cyclase [Ruminococcus sp.]MBO7474039.1 sensor domain-containing diguanylate cyclase [Ruminococcus sp.]